jgi:hypothetical protein
MGRPGDAYNIGLGPIGLEFSNDYDGNGDKTYRNFGISIEVSSCDISPFIGSRSIQPATYQVPIFIWNFNEL